jgi:hypothetical protein
MMLLITALWLMCLVLLLLLLVLLPGYGCRWPGRLWWKRRHW